MSSQEQRPHFVLIPLMAQGHLIPMMDWAKLLVHHGVTVTVVTTPHNAARFRPIFDRYVENENGLAIKLVQVRFPCEEAGLPEGCENIDMIPSLGTAKTFFEATNLLQQPVEKIFGELSPSPSCIISDMCLPFTYHIAKNFNIPRISFLGVSCFCLLCHHNILIHNVRDNVASDSEYFVVPDFPDKIEITIAQSGVSMNEKWEQFREEIAVAEKSAYGIIMNSFEELEPAYARDYKKVKNDKMWCIGPVSLINKDDLDKAERGRGSIDVSQYLKWLDCEKAGSVIYACLGSLCNLTAPQLIELGLALEASQRPFIWVIREGRYSEALEKWIEENGFEERTSSRSLLIRGWAPQLLILSHPAIGGFITHCGWNSTLEAICAGVPMITWPMFGDQFLNESLVVQVLKVGVNVGVETPMTWGEEEEMGLEVKKEDVERAIIEIMDVTSEGEERRKRIRELSEMAKRAVEKGGSSHSNVNLLIQDIMQKNKGDVL